ncbi:hypothetical protein LSTR_LSTR008398 [Laodelphax striatellus]|uniref:Follistatin-related protein 5 n=1 Tax=Laodelphax striatellus TaxID=195883 RepID=A0A482XSY4_LAOST|nr:hypothetical protein LSTR_LSTR008398 [Laodelphax striatellus]
MLLWQAVVLLSCSACLVLSKRSRHHRESTPSGDGFGEDASTRTTAAVPTTSTPPPALLDSDYPEDLSALTEQNPCLVQYCGKGRECRVIEGVAQCICQRRCRKHQKVVCGSDGRLYDNHCELHRTACLSNKLILVDHTFACLSRDGKEIVVKQNSSTDDLPSTISTRLSQSEQVDSNFSTEQTPFENPEENEADSDLYYDREDCTLQEYEIMKDNLLLLHHAKLMEESKKSPGKTFLVGNIFRYYDINKDGFLEREELDKKSQQEKSEPLSKGCLLQDMVSFEDADKDGRLVINEFYTAFSKLYSLSVVSLDKALEVNHLSARVGDNVEIKCDVSGTPPPPIVWRRNSADLSAIGQDDVRVFSDGSLYLTRIQLVHAGNYTCHAQRNRDITQTHVLTVHTIPEVKVTPRIQSRRPGEEAAMFCHVVGEPFPRVEWLKNDEPLKLDSPQKYDIIGNGTELRIHSIDYADTGAYMCQAMNVGGMTRDISSLIVQEEPTPTAPNEERRFFSFHDWGVSVYEPTACRLYHQIQSTDIIPGTQEYVCGDKGVNCSWGQAINVANRYVYVSQPQKDRVLVISKIQMVVVDVVITDKNPVALHYVPHLDQVWVLNWRSEVDEGVKTIQVIRDAAQKRKHHTVHPEPIDGQFDLVRDLFMPPVQDMSHMFKYGYVSHTNQRGLYKLDLANMRYIRSIDLTPYNCVPRSMQFSALYGFVIMECEEPMTGRATGQVLLDYLTDSVVSQKPGLLGRPAVTPNSRVVVTLDRARDGVTLVVQQVTETGLKFVFDVKTTLNISDMTFYPSQTTHGYDLYASAVDKEDILFLNLVTGKVEMITGVGKAMQPSLTQWGNPNRPIAASGVFGHYMVTPANEALFVVNGETRTVNCEIGGLVHPRAVVWVTMQLQ